MQQPRLRFLKLDLSDILNLGLGVEELESITKEQLLEVRDSNEDNDTGIEVLLIDLSNMTYYESHGNEWKDIESLKGIF